MENYKVPSDELTGDSNLNGRYRISFNVDITEDDCIALSDIVQSIVAGFEENPVLYKISDIGLEKINKEGQPDLTPKTFKAGDLVTLKQDVTIKVALSTYEGLYIVGAKSLAAEPLGEIDITIPQGTQATVNQVTGEGIELIDFDHALESSLMNPETGDFEAVTINLDSVIFLNSNIDSTLSLED